MLASECLNHPWLQKNITPAPPQPTDKIINTKNLRRFVIRRRWQVSDLERDLLAPFLEIGQFLYRFQKAVNALLALKRLGMNL